MYFIPSLPPVTLKPLHAHSITFTTCSACPHCKYFFMRYIPGTLIWVPGSPSPFMSAFHPSEQACATISLSRTLFFFLFTTSAGFAFSSLSSLALFHGSYLCYVAGWSILSHVTFHGYFLFFSFRPLSCCLIVRAKECYPWVIRWFIYWRGLVCCVTVLCWKVRIPGKWSREGTSHRYTKREPYRRKSVETNDLSPAQATVLISPTVYFLTLINAVLVKFSTSRKWRLKSTSLHDL